MWPEERKFLREAVLECAPTTVLEVGTWKGGGSTLQIASALPLGTMAKLHTCEVNVKFYEEAINNLKNTQYFESIIFYNSPSTDIIKQLISTKQIPQFIFLTVQKIHN